MAQLNNLVVKDEEMRLKLLRPIGRWGPSFTLPIYEAAVLSPLDNKTYTTFAAVKIISNMEEDYFNMAFQDVLTSQIFKNNPYILPFLSYFQAKVKGVTLGCIVLPYDNLVMSLRSVMSSNPRFSRGMDEEMIALVLERVLYALDVIHQMGKHHTRITADTVFFDLQEPAVFLAYAASLYERTTPNLNHPNCRPINGMLAWGLAPEVKHDESPGFVDVYETEKSDIWLVGILALELAYGRILVEDRRELLDIASYICSDPGVLTDSWKELRIKSAEFSPGGDPLGLPIVLSANRTRFSKRFGGFLARCLDADPENRASAEELLIAHDFLRENVGKMKTFSDMVTGINPHVDRFLDRDLLKKQAAASYKGNCHLAFRHNGITYTVLKSVGTWGPEHRLCVYEAVTSSGFIDPSPRHVAFKLVRNIEGGYFIPSMDSVERSASFNHINILPINSHFCKRIKGIETLFMVLPFDGQVLSLRSVMSNRSEFSNGIPQFCIAVALVNAVRGLHVLHTKNQDHLEITAGNIYYHIEDKSIKLAFAASCYERTYASEFCNCPIHYLLSWASPPEVDILERSGLNHKYDTFKGDIWFIGIAALELAYGKIRVANREELLRIASYISNVRRLPDTWDELRTETEEVEAQPKRKFLKFPTASDKPQRFDKYFGNFVAMCLDAEPDERPFANELLMDDFLRYIHEGESMEIFEANMFKGYTDLD